MGAAVFHVECRFLEAKNNQPKWKFILSEKFKRWHDIHLIVIPMQTPFDIVNCI